MTRKVFVLCLWTSKFFPLPNTTGPDLWVFHPELHSGVFSQKRSTPTAPGGGLRPHSGDFRAYGRSPCAPPRFSNAVALRA